MNTKDTTVVICCAGLGSRLGVTFPKALLEIKGKPLILHQLELLEAFDDIRVVVGYQAKKVIEIVKEYRKDIMFVFNYEYATTGPAASLKKGIVGARENIITLDGDLVIDKEGFKDFIAYENEVIAISEVRTEAPVFVNMINNKVVGFNEKSDYQWTGIAKIKKSRLKYSANNIYKTFDLTIPIDSIYLKAYGIDTKNDYINIMKWFEN